MLGLLKHDGQGPPIRSWRTTCSMATIMPRPIFHTPSDASSEKRLRDKGRSGVTTIGRTTMTILIRPQAPSVGSVTPLPGHDQIPGIGSLTGTALWHH